jgi:hypothetical protein
LEGQSWFLLSPYSNTLGPLAIAAIEMSLKPRGSCSCPLTQYYVWETMKKDDSTLGLASPRSLFNIRGGQKKTGSGGMEWRLTSMHCRDLFMPGLPPLPPEGSYGWSAHSQACHLSACMNSPTLPSLARASPPSVASVKLWSMASHVGLLIFPV